MRHEFYGDVQAVTVREFLDAQRAILLEAGDNRMARALVELIDACEEGGRLGLSVLVLISMTVALGGKLDEAIAALAPLSVECGLPVAITD
jgi:hypothetical protein